jgi:GT2 family glycosyltransferase
LLLLSPDTECLGSLANLLAAMRERAVGAAGCLLRQADGRVRPSIGFEHTPARLILSGLGLACFPRVLRCFKRVESDAGFYQHYRSEVDWVAGACLLTRRSLWKRLGGFDENFFMACEDIDYCRRVRLAGSSIAYVPAAAVMYCEGLDRPRPFETTLLRTSRSYLWYLSKHFGAGPRTVVGLTLAAVFLLRSLCYAVGALGRANAAAGEKFLAYARAGKFLLGASLGLRYRESRP